MTPGASGAPTFGVNAGDTRFLFVGEQGGRIRTLDFSLANPLTTDFLNMTAALAAIPAASPNRGTINVGTEKGLLGAAFHPDFNSTGTPGYRKFYTYTNENYVIGGASPSPTPQLFHQTEFPGSATNATTYDNQIVIREWTATVPDIKGNYKIDTAIEPRAVMRIGKPGQFHNAGALQFGPDGYLYFSIGDGGAGPSNGGNDGGNNTQNQGHTNPDNPDTPGGWTGQGNAQDRRNIYGKIIRIKPTTDADANTNPNTFGGGWRVPKSNPFTTESNATTPVPGWQDNWLDEIYAYGFRNPFRIGFDKLTGDLYAADVGQDRNTFSREEVDKIIRGGNYGWVIKSGTERNTNSGINALPIPADANLIDPIAQYPTTQNGPGGLAVIGGFVYRGNALPELQGRYIFGDLDGGGGIGRMLYTNPADAALNAFDLKIVGSFAKPSVRLHGVAQDGAGELYFLWENGQVTKLIPEPASLAIAILGALACLAHRRRHHRLGEGTTRFIRSRSRFSASELQ